MRGVFVQPRIETRLIKDLSPAPYNPRKIQPRALAGLTESIKRFGLVQPIIVNERTGNVVGGHQRIKALQALGEEFAQVLVIDLPEVEEKALNITLNNPHIEGEFDDGLDALLGEIGAFDSNEFDGLLFDDLAGVVEAAEAALPTLADGDRQPFQTMTFTLSDSQAEIVKRALDEVDLSNVVDPGGNQNSNGNALWVLAEAYLGNG